MSQIWTLTLTIDQHPYLVHDWEFTITKVCNWVNYCPQEVCPDQYLPSSKADIHFLQKTKRKRYYRIKNNTDSKLAHLDRAGCLLLISSMTKTRNNFNHDRDPSNLANRKDPAIKTTLLNNPSKRPKRVLLTQGPHPLQQSNQSTTPTSSLSNLCKLKL